MLPAFVLGFSLQTTDRSEVEMDSEVSNAPPQPSMTLLDVRIRFEQDLRGKLQGKAENSVVQTKIECANLLADLLRIQSDGAKSTRDFNLKRRFEILRVGGGQTYSSQTWR